MQKNYFVQTLAVLALAGIFLAFVFVRIQYDIYLSNQVMLKKSQDFHNKIAFTRFECSFPTDIQNDPVLQSIKGNLYGVEPAYIPKDLTVLPGAYSNTPNRQIYIHGGIKQPVIDMLSQARKEGIALGVNSGYRDFARQKRIYENPVNQGPPHEYDRAARPGFSEHQLGTAVDISAPIFANQYTINRGYAWLAQNAYKYGFVLSYPEGSEVITGFRYEPWHHRYVGVEIAQRLQNEGSLFNETTQAFYTHPFDGETSVRHGFLPEQMYVGLVSLFGNKTVISEDFLGSILTSNELQTLVTQSETDDRVILELEGELVSSTESLEFVVQRDTVVSNEKSYDRIKMVAESSHEGRYIFVDVVEIPRLFSKLLFAYEGEFDQSDILESYVLDRCR